MYVYIARAVYSVHIDRAFKILNLACDTITQRVQRLTIRQYRVMSVMNVFEYNILNYG
jgi:hypothetical protein